MRMRYLRIASAVLVGAVLAGALALAVYRREVVQGVEEHEHEGWMHEHEGEMEGHGMMEGHGGAAEPGREGMEPERAAGEGVPAEPGGEGAGEEQEAEEGGAVGGAGEGRHDDPGHHDHEH